MNLVWEPFSADLRASSHALRLAMKQRQLRRTRVADDDDGRGEAAAAAGTQAAQQQQPSGAPAAPTPATATAAAPAAPAAARSGAPASALNKPSSKAALLSFGGGDEEGEEDGPLAMAGKPRKDRKERKPKITRPQGLPDLPTRPLSTQRSAAGQALTCRVLCMHGRTFRLHACGSEGPVHLAGSSCWSLGLGSSFS